ncbi:MAG: type II toxin-antitoxin system VapB family antitoxin [Rubrivivax sp.]
MRTNIDIDDDTLDQAMRAGAFKTKKDAVEAGLKLLARQAAFKELLALRGKLHWDDAPATTVLMAEGGRPRARLLPTAANRPAPIRRKR